MLQSHVGVDIGSHSIKALQVAGGREPRIVRAGEVSLPPGTVVAGEVRDIDTVADALQVLWKQMGTMQRTVTFGIAGPQTLIRQVELPWEPYEVFRDALPLRLVKDLPVDPAEMVLNFHPLAERERGGVLMQHALVVGTLASASENAVQALTQAKLRAKRADYGPFALIRAACRLDPNWRGVPPQAEPGQERLAQAIVDVGAQVTTIVLHDGGRPLYVRTINAGSDSVTRALADQLSISTPAADLLKRRLGIGEVITGVNDLELSEEIAATAGPMAQLIVNAMAGSLVEVSRESVEYYLDAAGMEAVSHIALTGGGTMLPGFLERISAELRAPAARLEPMRLHANARAVRAPECVDPKFATAYGLATGV